MNHDEAKNILLLYRTGADIADPDIAEALMLAKSDAAVAFWFEEHCARQNSLRDKFRAIAPPAGLKEQIIAEELAKERSSSRREKFIAIASVAAIIVAVAVLAPFWLPHRAPPPENTLAIYQSQMVRIALSGYGMDTNTSDPEQIRAYLAKNQAPANYVLPPGLQKAAVTGCAIESWQNTKASMICFRTGKPLAPGAQSDLWLFVADRATFKDAPLPGQLQISAVNGLMTAVWSQDGNVYFLGTVGDRQTLEQFL
jgi:hypothetical protein